MTSGIDRADVKAVLRQSTVAWLLDYWGSDAGRQVEGICVDIVNFIAEYERRFNDRPDPLGLVKEHPDKGAAFFQFDTFLLSLEMKILIWRIFMGCQIKSVQFD